MVVSSITTSISTLVISKFIIVILNIITILITCSVEATEIDSARWLSSRDDYPVGTTIQI